MDVTVNVLLFGVLKDLFGSPREALTIDPESTVAQVVDVYRKRAPQQSGLFSSVATAVNSEFATLSTRLRDGDELALLPPVSGG